MAAFQSLKRDHSSSNGTRHMTDDHTLPDFNRSSATIPLPTPQRPPQATAGAISIAQARPFLFQPAVWAGLTTWGAEVFQSLKRDHSSSNTHTGITWTDHTFISIAQARPFLFQPLPVSGTELSHLILFQSLKRDHSSSNVARDVDEHHRAQVHFNRSSATIPLPTWPAPVPQSGALKFQSLKRDHSSSNNNCSL